MSRGMFAPYEGYLIDDLLARPGVYEVLNRFVELPGGGTGAETFRIEIEHDGTCHQLTREGKRDGVLSREGWAGAHLYVKIVATLKRFTFLIAFRNGETRTQTLRDTDANSARQLVWQTLPGKDQDRHPTITLLTSTEAAS